MDAPGATMSDSPNETALHADHHLLDRLCLDALRREALAWPKPGLVTPVDAGSHRDMHIGTFLTGIAALEGTFARLASSAACGEGLPALRAIGREAEQRMLAATGGVNTHRGAIHNLGFLAVAAVRRRGDPALAGLTCGGVVAREWGERISDSRTGSSDTHGNRVFRRFAAAGARGEAAAGFPTVYRIGIPTLRRLLQAGRDHETALIGTLLALIEHLDDTNLLWRGGEAGLAFARESAGTFNANGGVGQPCWREQLVAMHREFVARNLSPGGSADLVAATLVAHHLDLDGFI
ncbi:MAG: triphosphoribosyl-dephospho-CoA synthase MdcB [Deltaproteobacteria bacterium]|nr:triphosphoribosyl-dephospho-CoA synthase MdcB [Deltaproteobacteria bacterium]